MTSRYYVRLHTVLLTSLLIGCGPTEPVRVPVQGQVTVDGQIAEGGVVRFEPIGEERGSNRASAVVSIIDGKYQVKTGGGLREGRYRVEVEVQRKTGRKITKRVFDDVAEVDETALVSSPLHAGKDSPLEYTAESAANLQFDIDVPAQ